MRSDDLYRSAEWILKYASITYVSPHHRKERSDVRPGQAHQGVRDLAGGNAGAAGDAGADVDSGYAVTLNDPGHDPRTCHICNVRPAGLGRATNPYFSVPLFVANLGPPVAVDAGPAKAPQLERGADRIGFVVGWRAWLPLTLQGGRLLGSTSIAGSIWLPRVQSAAGCLVDPAGHDRPPVAGCSCGFWAFRSIAQLTLWRSTASTMVFGPVALWGRVLELERGYRAAYAYPLALFVPGSFALARGLEELYVVPSAAIGETQTPQSFALAMRVALERLITDGRVPPLPRASLRTVEEVFDPLDK